MMILSIMYQEALTLAMPSALFSTRTIRNFTCGCRDEPLLGLSACQHLTAKRDMNISGFKGFKQNHENIYEKSKMEQYHNIQGSYPMGIENDGNTLNPFNTLHPDPPRSSKNPCFRGAPDKWSHPCHCGWAKLHHLLSRFESPLARGPMACSLQGIGGGRISPWN